MLVECRTADEIRLRFEFRGIGTGIEESDDALDLGHGFDADSVAGQKKQGVRGHALLVPLLLARFRPTMVRRCKAERGKEFRTRVRSVLLLPPRAASCNDKGTSVRNSPAIHSAHAIMLMLLANSSLA